MRKILVVGPTPPPYGGQAVMIKNLLEAKYDNIQLYHVRADFSKDMSEIGKINFSKIISLIKLILKITYTKYRYKIKYLYFGPGGPNLVPMLRDIIMLNSTRYLFKKTIFHFHAGSTYSLYRKIPHWLKYFFRRAYFKSDISIRITEFNPDDPEKLKAKMEFIVPNGIFDNYTGYSDTHKRHENKTPTVLFVGNVFKEKGIVELIEASKILLDRNLKFEVNVIGRIESEKFKKILNCKIDNYKLSSCFHFLGVLEGNEKNHYYYNSDIFCLPTYFETFGLVIAEAMQFRMPIISTKVGGVPFLVKDNVNGFLVDKGQIIELANKLEILLKDEALRKQMGERSRNYFLENFTIEKFHINMEKVFNSLD